MAQNPEMIQPMLQQLAQENPQLAQLFAQNPEALMALLAGGTGPQVIQVTPEEQEAIQRVSEAVTFPSFDRALTLFIPSTPVGSPRILQIRRCPSLLRMRQE